MVSLAPSAHLDASVAAGPLLIVYILNWVFFGVLSFQVYLYYLSFNDHSYIKAAVYLTYTLECVQIVLLTYAGFKRYVIQLGGSLVIFDEVGTLWLTVPIISGLIGLIVQSFYAYRLYMLTSNKYLTVVIEIFSLCQVGLAIGLGLQVRKEGRLSKLFETHALIVTGIWGGGSATCDVLIAGSMIYYLTRWDTDTIKKTRTHDIIWRIIRLTVETGTMTAIIAISAVIFISLPGRPPYYQTCIGILRKAYSNSVMVILNSRLVISAPSYSFVCQPEQQLVERGRKEGLVFASTPGNTGASTTATMEASSSTAN